MEIRGFRRYLILRGLTRKVYKMPINILRELDSLFQTLVKLWITVPYALIIMPPSLSLIFMAFILRTCVIISAKFFRPDFSRPLELFSAAIAGVESPYEKPVITLFPLLVLEGTPDLKKLREDVRSKLFRKKDIHKGGDRFYPEALQNVEYFMGYPFWKNIEGMTEDKALQENIVTYKSEGGWDHKTMLAFAKKFVMQPFRKDQPLWHAAVFEDFRPNVRDNPEGKPHFVIGLKVHHSLTDGTGLLSILQDIGKDITKNAEEIVGGQHHRKQPSLVATVVRILFRGLYDLVTFWFNQITYTLDAPVWPKTVLDNNSSTLLQPSDRFHNLAAAQTHSISTCSTLSQVRMISRSVGVSGTSVMITAVLRSVRNTVHSNQVAPSHLVFHMPLFLPGHSLKLRNRCALVFMLLPFAVDNPITHVREVDKAFKDLKGSSLPPLLGMIVPLGGLFPYQILRLWSKLAKDGRTDMLVLSTLVGPKETPDICGHKVRGISTVIPAPVGERFPMFQLVTVSDKIHLSIMANTKIIQDDEQAEKIVLSFQDEIHGMLMETMVLDNNGV